MITIWDLEIQLPASLIFLSGDIGSFLGTLLASLLGGLFLYFFLSVVVYRIFRRTESELDDIILGVTYKPLIFFSILLGLEKAFEVFGVVGWVGWIERVLWIGIVVTITYWLAHLFKDVIIGQLEIYSRNSDVEWDDILAPAIKTIVPPLIYLLGIIIALQLLGLNLTGLYVALGGTAFIIGFALQDPLSNLFSGLVILLDAPFQVEDVIKLDGETIAVIKKVGLRVTHVYDSQHHVDIFIPNSSFGGGNIVNITRPTTDLAVSLTIGVGYSSDVAKVERILREIVNGHPDIFASQDIQDNLIEREKLIRRFGSFSADKKIEKSLLRLRAENKVNELLMELERHLGQFSRLAARLEKGGLSSAEIIELQNAYKSILSNVGLSEIRVNRRWPKRAKWRLEVDQKTTSSLIYAINDWLKAWMEDPNLVPDDMPDEDAIETLKERLNLNEGEINLLYLTLGGDMDTEDLGKLGREWVSKVRKLVKRIEHGYELVYSPVGYERQLDNYSSLLREWMQKEFKQRAVGWRDPDIYLVNTGASSLDFQINYYVDNIKLEHWERADRIKNELLREILRRFQEENIEIPFPQSDVWFRNNLSIVERRSGEAQN